MRVGGQKVVVRDGGSRCKVRERARHCHIVRKLGGRAESGAHQ